MLLINMSVFAVALFLLFLLILFFWCIFWRVQSRREESFATTFKKCRDCNKSERGASSCTFLCAHSPKGLGSFIKITETSFGPGSDPELPGVIIPEQTHIQNKVKTQTRKPVGAGGAR